MEKNRKISLVVLVAITCILGVSIVSAKAPWTALLKRHPLNRQVVKIGVIYAYEDAEVNYSPLLELASEDINEYCDKLGYRVEFSFIEENAYGSPEIHQEYVEMFHDMGVNLLIAGGWSSHASYSLDYVNENNMLMFSPSSTDYELAEDDNLYRLAPDDNYQSTAMVEMLVSRGVDSIVILYIDDGGWGPGLKDAIADEFVDRGGTFQAIDSPGTFRGHPEYDFTPYLTDAQIAAYDLTIIGDNVGFLVIGFDEVAGIINQVYEYPSTYPTLDSLTWYGPDGVARSQKIVDEAWDGAAKYEMYSTQAAPTRSEKWYAIEERLGYEPGFYPGCLYDICWIYAKAVLESSTSATEGVKAILPDVSSQYYGITGWCNLNDAGDRDPLDYDIWKFDETDGWILAGHWDKNTGEIYLD